MLEGPEQRVARTARRRVVEQAYRSYATLVVEHERARRAHWRRGPAAAWRPDPAALATVRFLASVHEPSGRAARTLADFLARSGAEAAVPLTSWREALAAGIDLVADVLVAHAAELPWGRKRRVPRKAEDFEAICRFLRDLPMGDDAPPLAPLLDAADLPAGAPRPAERRVTFYRGRHVLSVDGARVSLPHGRELAFLETLADRRHWGEVTPRHEHGIDWRRAVEQLRRRIRRATRQDLLRAVVLPATAPVGGYRLAPAVRVRTD